jgi:hypothetical protein
MANLTELSQWEAGIYQLETTDPVEGGSGGISNEQARLLGNRTKWLYDKALKFLPRNRGYITGLDLGGATGPQSVGGDIESASKSVVGSSTVLTINLANSMGNTNYDVEVSIHNLSADLAANMDIYVPTFKPVSATQCQVALREASGGGQDLKLNIKVISLD